MRIVACAVFKGGTGKTTAAVNLAAALSLLNRRVLLIDTDTQGQAGKHLGMSPTAGLLSFVDGRQDAIEEARPYLDILTGGPGLAGLKTELARRPIGGERAISEALTAVNGQYDYVILDTGPGFDALSIAALFAAGEILAPVKMEPLAVDGLILFLQQLGDIQKYHDVKLSYILPSGLDRRVAQTDEIYQQLLQHFDGLVCDPIRYNVRLSEAAGHKQHIFEYAPDSNGAADFATLTQRVMDNEQA